MQPKSTNIASHAATALVALAVGSVLSVAAAYWASNQVEREAILRFENTVTDAQNAVESRVRAYSDVLLGAKGLFIASDSVRRDEFRDYVDSLDLNRRYPGITAVLYAQRITAGQKQAFEAAMRNDTSVDPRGYPDFAINPPGDRPEYVVVQYIEPMAGNRAALGIDQAGEAVRLAALERARDSNRITASGQVVLAVDPRNLPGILMRLAVYRKGMPLATEAQRREAFAGTLSTAFIVTDLMRGVLSERFLQQAHVRIHDAGFLGDPSKMQPPTTENLLFDSDRLLVAPSSQSVSSGGKLAGPTRMSVLDVGGRRWNLYFSVRQELGSPSDRWLPLGILFGGITVSLLLFGLIRSLATVRSRAVVLAASITEDLHRSEAALAKAQRQTQELIEALPNPVFFKSTDGRYLGVNRAWEIFFGVSRDTFIGKTVYDLYPNDPEGAKRLQADDQVLWEHPGTRVYETSITTPGGQRHDVIYYKATFTHSDGSVAGLIGTIVDISGRKQAETLRTQLAAIVENSNDAIFSRTLDGTILSWNAGAEKMLGYTAAEVIGKPIAVTLPPDRPPNLTKNNEMLLRGEVVARESDRMTKDGRVIDVLTSHSPIRDSAGNIVGASIILQDITALKQAQAAAKASEGRYRVMFENAAVGITRVDLSGVLVDVNQKFCELLGYTREELIDRTIKDITHPDDYGQGAAYRSEITQGAIKAAIGEKRFVRKDGSIMWARRTMSIARDDAGNPQYVISVVEDITERKQAETALRDSEMRYRSVIAAIAEGVVLRDKDARIVTCNASAERILGKTLDQMRGSMFYDPNWQAIREDGTPFPLEERPIRVALRTGQLQSNVVQGLRKPDGTVL